MGLRIPLPYPVPRTPLQIFFLLALCALITLPNLAAQGLTSSEGHRVIPALEMLQTGDYQVPHMFHQPYLRKPQLTPWLFAAALKLHNDPTLTPRIVSALAFSLTVLASFLFAQRWFGKRAGFPAALALTLTPLYWSPARAAEIESIHNLTTALGTWIVIELLIRAPKSKHTLLWSIALVPASLAMILTKGPAGFPIFLALLIASAALNRSIKMFFNPYIWTPAAIAALVFVWHWSNTLAAAGPDAIIQSPNAFMYEPDQLLKLVGFIPVSLLTALPITLALLFPWGKDASTEAESNSAIDQLQTARLIALAVPLALLIMNLTGISNDRYAQPILITAAPLVGWLLAIYSTAQLQPHRTKILRAMTLGSPKILAALLCAGAVLYITKVEPTNRSTSGKQPAIKLATELANNLPPAHYTLVADAMIEARPETLMYLSRALDPTTHQLDIHWIPTLSPERLANLATHSQSPQPPLLALIRTDENANESDKLLVDRVIATGTVHEFEFALVTLKLEPF